MSNFSPNLVRPKNKKHNIMSDYDYDSNFEPIKRKKTNFIPALESEKKKSKFSSALELEKQKRRNKVMSDFLSSKKKSKYMY